MMHSLSYDYQLTYLFGTSRDVMGEISGNRVRISIPSLIDNFGRNLVDEMVTTLNVILLHELSHWGEERDYGDDFAHSPRWNEVLVGVAFGG
jgi:hypothetical protein